MFVTVVGVGFNGDFSSLENLTWKNIEYAIRQLNGEELGDILLGVEADAPQMMICGGENTDSYVCTITYDEETYYILSEPRSSSDDMVLIPCGGVDGAFPRRHISSLESVIIAAKAFSERGERDAGLNWITE